MTGLLYVTMTFFIIVCAILILLILIQKGRGGGLASAFGGAGGQTAFGSKTGDVLTWATSIVFFLFVVLAVSLNLVANRIDNTRGAGVNKPIAAAAPVLPGNPQSSLPQAPVAPPGITSPPPVAPAPMQTPMQTPTTLTSGQSMSPATMPTTTKVIERIIPMSSTLPTTLP